MKPSTRKVYFHMSILEKIVQARTKDVEEKKDSISEQLLWRHARGMLSPPDFNEALLRNKRQKITQPALIAELKKASPSAGLMRGDFPVISLARELESGGAAALSVLTEPHFFQGNVRFLRLASDNVAIPVLCKDFIIDPFQIAEARVYGASAVLLIVAALDKAGLQRLLRVAGELQMTALVEVHTEEELEIACNSGAGVIGVNSRDLATFETDIEATADLLRKIPDGITRVAESGIENADDTIPLKDAGADAILVGGSIMKAHSPGQKAAELSCGKQKDEKNED